MSKSCFAISKLDFAREEMKFIKSIEFCLMLCKVARKGGFVHRQCSQVICMLLCLLQSSLKFLQNPHGACAFGPRLAPYFKNHMLPLCQYRIDAPSLLASTARTHTSIDALPAIT